MHGGEDNHDRSGALTTGTPGGPSTTPKAITSLVSRGVSVAAICPVPGLPMSYEVSQGLAVWDQQRSTGHGGLVPCPERARPGPGCLERTRCVRQSPFSGFSVRAALTHSGEPLRQVVCRCPRPLEGTLGLCTAPPAGRREPHRQWEDELDPRASL